MAKKIKISELGSLFNDMDVESLEGVTIEGDIELEMDAGSGLDPQLAHMLGHEASQIARHLINISQFMR